MAAGLPAVAEVFAQVDPKAEIEASVADGARLTDSDALLRLSGPARSLITGERTTLNASPIWPTASSCSPPTRRCVSRRPG
ncbi:hypothetical protein ABZT03_28840 [Streptomyces sp. NPDC005574]|uniref:hypothetical protein n=1 Tax=Streptomyces sp. NPDC005574 TaxID=3156891 RepID=UPI0033A025B2